MRIFEKSVKLNNVCYDIRGPVMDEAGRMEAEGVKILKLNIGNPATFGFRAPQQLVDIMSSNLDKTEGYSDSRGLLAARQAIIEYDKKKGIDGVELTDVYTGNGVSELITLSMQGLLDYGDEILVPSPDYPLWTASVSLAGGTAVHYICDEKSGWYPDLKDIERKITPRTKGIVVINPNNPTGALYPKEILEGIVRMAELHDLIIFADEIYDRLVMDGKQHVSIASLTDKCLCITFNGLSKSHLVAGYRVGWMSISGAKKNARGYLEGINMLSNMRLCSNVPAQSLIAPALSMEEETRALVVPGGRVYEQRKCIVDAINDIPGLHTTTPEAAFYCFPKMDVKKFRIRDDERFALDLLHREHILLTHGGGFHWEKPDHFRIVYLPEVKVLKEAAAAFSRFFDGYRQADPLADYGVDE
ncbi:MAG: aminotransferase class I/II-fold pyridoxal phosphate-dependent enzyme [Firmicutes bacterium]|nr:aminotransferase class I/II-fold pyridoxal phosphate-dependent enzyme [Bacillota bacterium]